MKLRVRLLGIGLALAAGPGLAAEGQLVCDMNATGPYRGTPDRAVVGYRQGVGTMPVNDSLLVKYGRAPVEAKTDREDGKTLVLRWTLKNAKFDNGDIRNMRLALNWSKASGQARISAQPGGVPTKFIGLGRCALARTGGAIAIAAQKTLPKLGPVPRDN